MARIACGHLVSRPCEPETYKFKESSLNCGGKRDSTGLQGTAAGVAIGDTPVSVGSDAAPGA